MKREQTKGAFESRSWSSLRPSPYNDMNTDNHCMSRIGDISVEGYMFQAIKWQNIGIQG